MTAVQQYRSTFLAQPRRRIVLEGEDGGDGEPKVAITMGASSCRACGAVGAASECFSEILAWPTSSRVWVEDREGDREGQSRGRTSYPVHYQFQGAGSHSMSHATMAEEGILVGIGKYEQKQCRTLSPLVSCKPRCV